MAKLPTSIVERLRATEKLSDHLDPDLISAWVENSLSRADRARVFEHLAYCGRCRDVSALSLPDPAEVAVSPATVSAWLGWPILRWGAMAACVLVVGAAITLRHRSASGPRQPAGPEIVALEPQPSAASPISSPARTVTEKRDETRKSVPGKQEPGSPRAFAEKSAAPSGQSLAGSQAAEEQTVESAHGMAVTSFPGPSTGLDEGVPGRAKNARQVSGNATLAKAVDGRAPQAAGAIPSPADFEAGTAQKPVPRWTLASDGTLERSFDSGNTWETVPAPSHARFYVLSAHTMDIWLGGSAGALYHSFDAGEHWVQVQPVVNGQPLTEDVIEMEFTDPEHGVVTTPTNQKWVTEDAGQIWKRK
ncbi:MAG TPA: zf-HC2 domain-containing protein [Terriglobales bacterium]|nr:zf-HC2 domain-containing protein [Terriglobales bacterium]